MKLSELFDKLEKSSEFKKFKTKFPEAYFCAAFVVFDYDSKDVKQQLDYYVSEDEGIMTFLLDKKIISKKAEMIEREILKEIKKDEIKIDLDEVVEKAEKEAEKQHFKPAKIIAILQRLKEDEKLIWNLTCLSGFTILRMHVAMDGKVLLNQKSSMMDLMRIEKGNKKAKGSEQDKTAQVQSPADSADAQVQKDSADYVG